MKIELQVEKLYNLIRAITQIEFYFFRSKETKDQETKDQETEDKQEEYPAGYCIKTGITFK